LMDLGFPLFGLENPFWGLGESLWSGLARSVVFAVLVTLLAGWLVRKRVALRI
jgi:hypothetical protein